MTGTNEKPTVTGTNATEGDAATDDRTENADADAPEVDGERASISGRGPWFDRLSAAVAVAGYLVLATNEAPVVADVPVLDLVVGSLAVGLLAALALFRLVGPFVLEGLWIGLVTAIFLWIVALAVLFVAGATGSEYVWTASLASAVFGLGVTVRATRARLARRP
ncbi:hypothetical protein [Halovivax sp.]|uniref:hypothetical protein n=1 Tax=Halovivax sp. TaxID=1935978 RepID=UPI0025C6197F|nr:hypothetical protein [Halovivax sp.]